jgi:hypothetical protein
VTQESDEKYFSLSAHQLYELMTNDGLSHPLAGMEFTTLFVTHLLIVSSPDSIHNHKK